jgi:hypothetical protein
MKLLGTKINKALDESFEDGPAAYAQAVLVCVSVGCFVGTAAANIILFFI